MLLLAVFLNLAVATRTVKLLYNREFGFDLK